jgi:hypothetical protein
MEVMLGVRVTANCEFVHLPYSSMSRSRNPVALDKGFSSIKQITQFQRLELLAVLLSVITA